MTSPVSAIEAIEKAMEGVTPGPWNDHRDIRLRGQHDVGLSICFVNCENGSRTDIEARANAAYIVACNPVAMREVLALARQAEALQRENAELAKSFLEVLNAVRDYLPPDGISAGDCLSRVIGAVDNSGINPLIKKLEHADVDA